MNKKLWLIYLFFYAAIVSCTKEIKGSKNFIVGYYSLKFSAIDTNDTITKSSMLLNIMTDSILYYDIYFDSIPKGEVPISYVIYKNESSITDSIFLEGQIKDYNNKESIGSDKISSTLYNKLISKSDSLYIKIKTTNYSNGLVNTLINF